MLTPPACLHTLAWRMVKRLRKFPAMLDEGPEMGRGSPNPLPHTYCTDGETETQRGDGEAHRHSAGLLSGACFPAWMPEPHRPGLKFLRYHPPKYSLSFPQCKVGMITVPGSLHCGYAQGEQGAQALELTLTCAFGP